MQIKLSVLLRSFSAFLPLLQLYSKKLLAMRNNYVRLVSSDRSKVNVSLSHQIKEHEYVSYGEFTFSRDTGSLFVTWDYKCPLTIVEKLKEILWFVKLCRAI